MKPALGILAAQAQILQPERLRDQPGEMRLGGLLQVSGAGSVKPAATAQRSSFVGTLVRAHIAGAI